jgi:dTMP kinase
MIERSMGAVFVVFEGLDGSGKSTCAQRVAERLGARYLTTPSPEVREYRAPLVESFGGSQEAAQLFYLATVFAASDEVRRLLAKGVSVVLDRYFLSTQAYADFRGSRLDVDALGELLVPADVTVYLDVPLEIRRQRLAARGTSTGDRETLSERADAQLRANHARRAGLSVIGKWLSFKAATETPEELEDLVVGAVEAELRRRVTSRPLRSGT